MEEALIIKKLTFVVPLENFQAFCRHLEVAGFLPCKVGVEPEQYFRTNVGFFRILF